MISVEHATKTYRLAKAGALKRRTQVTALYDVTFTVAPGEIVGLIGRNGAGKTTLLRAIGGTCPLDSGRIRCQTTPRMILSLLQSLLPHISGRENIYLYGSFLGLLKSELQALEEEIIAMAELNDVIDEPLQNYSAGMKTRLAFSIATAGNPSIICLDEILSVGDSGFMEKAINRIFEIKKRGGSVIIASHDRFTLAKVCDRLALIEAGRLVAIGQPTEIVARYLTMLGL